MPPKQDLLWEALVSVCGADASEMTKSERGRYNKALKDLRDVGATPEQIRARAGRYRMKYPNLEVTPTALAAHWSSLRGPARKELTPLEASVASHGIGMFDPDKRYDLTHEAEPELTPEQRQANIDRLNELIGNHFRA